MLHVALSAAGRRWALSASAVVEVVPLVTFTPLPHAPEYVLGLFTYRGTVIPAVDLSVLAGGAPAPRLLSTRIVVVDAPDAEGRACRTGLVAEHVTDVLGGAALASGTPVSLAGAPWVAGVLAEGDGLVTCLDPRGLVPPDVRALLAPAVGAA